MQRAADVECAAHPNRAPRDFAVYRSTTRAEPCVSPAPSSTCSEADCHTCLPAADAAVPAHASGDGSLLTAPPAPAPSLVGADGVAATAPSSPRVFYSAACSHACECPQTRAVPDLDPKNTSAQGTTPRDPHFPPNGHATFDPENTIAQDAPSDPSSSARGVAPSPPSSEVPAALDSTPPSPFLEQRAASPPHEDEKQPPVWDTPAQTIADALHTTLLMPESVAERVSTALSSNALPYPNGRGCGAEAAGWEVLHMFVVDISMDEFCAMRLTSDAHLTDWERAHGRESGVSQLGFLALCPASELLSDSPDPLHEEARAQALLDLPAHGRAPPPVSASGGALRRRPSVPPLVDAWPPAPRGWDVTDRVASIMFCVWDDARGWLVACGSSGLAGVCLLPQGSPRLDRSVLQRCHARSFDWEQWLSECNVWWEHHDEEVLEVLLALEHLDFLAVSSMDTVLVGLPARFESDAGEACADALRRTFPYLPPSAQTTPTASEAALSESDSEEELRPLEAKPTELPDREHRLLPSSPVPMRSLAASPSPPATPAPEQHRPGSLVWSGVEGGVEGVEAAVALAAPLVRDGCTGPGVAPPVTPSFSGVSRAWCRAPPVTPSFSGVSGVSGVSTQAYGMESSSASSSPPPSSSSSAFPSPTSPDCPTDGLSFMRPVPSSPVQMQSLSPPREGDGAEQNMMIAADASATTPPATLGLLETTCDGTCSSRSSSPRIVELEQPAAAHEETHTRPPPAMRRLARGSGRRGGAGRGRGAARGATSTAAVHITSSLEQAITSASPTGADETVSVAPSTLIASNPPSPPEDWSPSATIMVSISRWWKRAMNALDARLAAQRSAGERPHSPSAASSDDETSEVSDVLPSTDLPEVDHGAADSAPSPTPSSTLSVVMPAEEDGVIILRGLSAKEVHCYGEMRSDPVGVVTLHLVSRVHLVFARHLDRTPRCDSRPDMLPHPTSALAMLLAKQVRCSRSVVQRAGCSSPFVPCSLCGRQSRQVVAWFDDRAIAHRVWQEEVKKLIDAYHFFCSDAFVVAKFDMRFQHYFRFSATRHASPWSWLGSTLTQMTSTAWLLCITRFIDKDPDFRDIEPACKYRLWCDFFLFKLGAPVHSFLCAVASLVPRAFSEDSLARIRRGEEHVRALRDMLARAQGVIATYPRCEPDQLLYRAMSQSELLARKASRMQGPVGGVMDEHIGTLPLSLSKDSHAIRRYMQHHGEVHGGGATVLCHLHVSSSVYAFDISNFHVPAAGIFSDAEVVVLAGHCCMHHCGSDPWPHASGATDSRFRLCVRSPLYMLPGLPECQAAARLAYLLHRRWARRRWQRNPLVAAPKGSLPPHALLGSPQLRKLFKWDPKGSALERRVRLQLLGDSAGLPTADDWSALLAQKAFAWPSATHLISEQNWRIVGRADAERAWCQWYLVLEDKVWIPWVLARESPLLPAAGLGLFACIHFPAECSVVVYTGEALNSKQHQLRVASGNADHMLQLNDQYVDGRLSWTGAQYINDSHRLAANNNCRFADGTTRPPPLHSTVCTVNAVHAG